MTIRTILAVCLLSASLSGANAVVASEWEDSTNALCRGLIEQRDNALFEEGRKAAIAIVSVAVSSGSLPAAVERPQLMEVLQRQRDDLQAAYEALADRSAQEQELAAEWGLFLGTGAHEIELLDRRIEALGSGRFEPHQLMRDQGTGTDALEQALAALGFLGRDCEMIFSSPGVPSAQAEFINAGARICAEAVDRRAARYVDDFKTMIPAMLAKGEVEGDRTALVSAAQALHAEWQQTAEAFRTIDASAAPDAQLWGKFLNHVDAIGEVYASRAAALESGSAEQLATAFRPLPTPAVTPEMLGLNQTDCRTLTF